MAFALALLVFTPEAQADRFEYLTRISGIDDTQLRGAVEAVSRLKSLESDPPASLSALRRRTDKDLELFSKVLRSEGYYDHAIRYRLDTSVVPMRVRIRIEPGPPYKLSRFDVVLTGDDLEPAMEAVERATGNIELDKQARAKDVVDAENAVIAELARSSFPFPKLVARDAVADHAVRAVRVRTTIDVGRRARFGEVQIHGVTGPLAEYARRRIPWDQGALYDPDKLESLRARLASTGLFSGVRVVPASDVVEEDGLLAVRLVLERSKPRSIGAGVRYSSDEGAGGAVFWEHRDLFGRAERLRITADVSQLGESGALTFRKPDFFSVDQTLIFDSSFDVEDTEAFQSEKFKTSLGLERPLAKYWTGVLGIGLELGPVEGTTGRERNILLVGFPALKALRDSSNSVLDPTSGSRLSFGVTPYTEELGSEISFAVGRVGQSFYYPFDRGRHFVFAGRSVIGGIAGAGRFAVPPDKRFYAGGGGSVRGFAFQLAGPLDADEDPIGGRSLIELGAELRWRPLESFGVVPFVDGGNVFEQEYPSFDDGLFWGAGLGVRYFSPVGPIRLDVATPLNPRDGIDDPVQFYISLGQAF